MLTFMRSIRKSLAVVSLIAAVAASCTDAVPEASQPEPAPQVQQVQQVQPVQQDQQASQSEQSAANEPQQAQADRSDRSGQSGQSEQAQTEPSEQGAQDDPQAEQQAVAPADDPAYLPRDATETAEGIPIIRDSERPEYFGTDWGTDWGIRLVEFDELSQGAFRDAIPAISEPRYWSLEEAAETYAEHSPLVHVDVNGDVRGFPLDILIFHEIVNDVIGGVPVTVTFCPLCNTAIAFESQVGDEVYRFGVSGLLRNSDLVMYDRNTESLWQQSSGRAIVGVMVGARLTYVPATIVTLGHLRESFPDALVMSRDTGWPRSYGQNPYRGYDDPEQGGPYYYFFDRETIDERLPPAERVVSIEGPSGAAIAYAWSGLSADRVIQDDFDGVELVIFWVPGALSALDNGFIEASREVGTTAVFERSVGGRELTFAANWRDESRQTFVDNETESIWNIFGIAVEGELAGSRLTRVVHSDHFWFAWQAFHPETEVVLTARQAASGE